MKKLKLAEEIIKNSQAYDLRFIDYQLTDEGIVVRNIGGHFSEHRLMTAIETIGLHVMVRQGGNGVELLVYAP